MGSGEGRRWAVQALRDKYSGAEEPRTAPSNVLLKPKKHLRTKDFEEVKSFVNGVLALIRKLLFASLHLCRAAQLRLCADGGANRLYDEMPLLFPREDAVHVRNRYKQDVIKGDMDSNRTEVLDFYANLGTETLDESQDQDTTDLHKCVAYNLRDFRPDIDKSNLCILVAGALGGRFDHEIGKISHIPFLEGNV